MGVWVCSPTKKKPKAEQETAQPTAARLKKKTRAEQEPRSAHGRAVKKDLPPLEVAVKKASSQV